MNRDVATADAQAEDMALLRRYVEQGSQDAFNLIVGRHLNWVHATCRKGLRDRHMAEDAAQAVFIILARRAPTLPPQTRLSGWLFNTARFVIKDAKKQETRYRRRENVAREMSTVRLAPVREAVDAQTQAVLDDALATLTERDRLSLLMHFYEGLSLAEMADTLGITKDGAKKRVARALSRLRARMGRNGKQVAATIATLALLLRSRATEAAPLGLGQTVASGAIVPGVASSVARWMAQRAMVTAAGASSRLLKALVAAELGAAVALVGVWVMPERGAERPMAVASGPTLVVPDAATPVMPGAAPAPAETAVAVVEPASPYRSGAFDVEPRLDPLPPYAPAVEVARASDGGSGAVGGSGGPVGGSGGWGAPAIGARRVIGETASAPQAIARVVLQQSMSLGAGAGAGAGGGGGSASASSSAPLSPSRGRTKGGAPAAEPEDGLAIADPGRPVDEGSSRVSPSKGKGRAKFSPPMPLRLPDSGHPLAKSEERFGGRAGHGDRDGRTPISIAFGGPERGAGHWHVRRGYGEGGRGTRKGRPGKWQGYGLAGGVVAPVDDDDVLCPGVDAEDVLGGPPVPAPQAQGDSGGGYAETDRPGPPITPDYRSPWDEGAAGGLAMGPTVAGVGVEAAQAPEPGAVGMVLMACAAGLATRRRRRRGPAPV